MKRPDWSSRLFGVIEEHRNRPFAWSADYCALFVARCVDAMTDSDIELSLLAQYDEGSAKRFAARGDLASAVTEYLGQPVEGRAVRGDVVLVDGGEGAALGICLGSKVVAMGASGLRYLPRAEIKLRWVV